MRRLRWEDKDSQEGEQDIMGNYKKIDKDDILSEKESPTDNIEKFEQLLDKNIYKLR